MISNTFVFLYDLYHWSEVASCKNKLERRNEKFDKPKHDYEVLRGTQYRQEAKREMLFRVVVCAYYDTFTRDLSRGRNLATTFVNDSKFESSKGLSSSQLTIVGSLWFIYSAGLSSHSPCSLFSPLCVQTAARNTIPCATLDRVWLWESICQRIFPFGYVRIKGRRAYPFLTYSHTYGTFYCIYIDSTFTRKFFQRRYYDMNKQRGFYRPRPSFSPSYDES